MIAIKIPALQKMPDGCDDCIYYGILPHPYKGWTERCELCNQCLDDDQEEGWIFGGNDRPKNCPLVEIKEV